jgi:EAL domain-containing protein (putative c-di-GMP-specific phosphodiesterase class I)
VGKLKPGARPKGAGEPVWTGVVACLCLIAVTLGGALVAIMTLGALAAILLTRCWVLARDLENACARVRALGIADHQPSSGAALAESIQALEQRFMGVDHRLSVSHPISGLPMREALLAQIGAAGSGILGAIAFADYDRLCAFDPEMGERVLVGSIERLRRMVTPDRFVAHVDRAHLGLWFGAGISEESAHAELEAIAYALGEGIVDGDQQILPQVRVRQACFAGGSMTPQVFLARTLASFALPIDLPSATVQQPVDHAELARERYALEQGLHHAIDRNELHLHFQPLIDAHEGRVCGAEALVRWVHPIRGSVSPSRFIPIMEAMGLAKEIGLWVLNAAVREAHAWQKLDLGHLRVAVNVSGLQLESDDLPILVQRTLQRHGLAADALEIELTESVATSDADHCRSIFQTLRAMGVKLAVDDFGTGFSSFSTLRALAFDKIKIDREFVTDVDTRADSQAICQSIIALGRGLGIRVLAEGVEQRAEYEWLRRHGCFHFQGYYFAQPMTAGAFAGFVRDSSQLSRLLSLGVAAEQQKISERFRL